MIELLSETVYKKTFKMDKYKGFEQRVLLTSDRHDDNPKSDRKLQELHLRQAKERNARVYDFWDFFCAMQGKGDPRHSKDDIRPENMKGNYLNSIVESSVDFFTPYADLFDLITYWNHETSVKKKLEVDLIQWLVFWLNTKTRSSIKIGKYAGWVKFCFVDEKGKNRWSVRLNYTHWYWWGWPVTKWVIQTNRKATYLPDADICVSGHIHEQWVVKLARERVSERGQTYMDYQYHICLPTYKEEYMCWSGYHREKGRPPKPLWARWLKFYYCTRSEKIRFKVIEADT